MCFWKSTRSVSVSLACCGLLFPSGAFAQQPVLQPSAVKSTAQPTQNGRVADVQLDKERALVGVVVNATGDAVPQLTVQLWQRNKLLQTIESNHEGGFHFEGLRGGTYQIAVGDKVQVLRCWAAGSAPPQARDTLRLKVTEEIMRGQGKPPVCGVVNPWLIAGIAVAAVVIPIALHNSRSDRNASE
jgi:hypothetical protein